MRFKKKFVKIGKEITKLRHCKKFVGDQYSEQVDRSTVLPQIPVCIAGNFSLNCKLRQKNVTEFTVYRNLQLPEFAVIFTYLYEAYQTSGS